MATAEQVKSLVKAYVDHDEEKFKTVALQIAAHEARAGHDTVARDLKKEIDKISKMKPGTYRIEPANPLFLFSTPSVKKNDLIVSTDLETRIERVLTEFRNRRKLQSYGYANRRKLLLEGASGTGKTLTASVIASELGLPLYTVQMDKLVSKFMGETSAKLRQVFESMYTDEGVYFFDEFDAIGSDRSFDNEVGEMRRILNSFLQFIEQDSSDSLIISATNNQKLLDKALFRRFDDVLHYDLPAKDEIYRLFEYKIGSFAPYLEITGRLIDEAVGLSHAEIVRVSDDAIKNSILHESQINEQEIIDLLKDRHLLYKGA
ncbi:MAG: AAA family ATPase [Candidatus Ornithospirochaeta sp.]